MGFLDNLVDSILGPSKNDLIRAKNVCVGKKGAYEKSAEHCIETKSTMSIFFYEDNLYTFSKIYEKLSENCFCSEDEDLFGIIADVGKQQGNIEEKVITPLDELYTEFNDKKDLLERYIGIYNQKISEKD